MTEEQEKEFLEHMVSILTIYGAFETWNAAHEEVFDGKGRRCFNNIIEYVNSLISN